MPGIHLFLQEHNQGMLSVCTSRPTARMKKSRTFFGTSVPHRSTYCATLEQRANERTAAYINAMDVSQLPRSALDSFHIFRLLLPPAHCRPEIDRWYQEELLSMSYISLEILGKKFNFINHPPTKHDLSSLILSMDKIADLTNEYGQNFFVKLEFKNLIDSMAENSHSYATPSQSFIKRIAEKAREFLNKNKNIVVSFADKGGKTVIMDSDIYAAKIHKEEFPPRPIISNVGTWCNALCKWMLPKLQKIADFYGEFKVKNSEDLHERIANKPLKDITHRLSTFDYDSMFTNVPVEHTIKIISEDFDLISEETCVPMDLFIKTIVFIVKDCSYFLYGGIVYNQCKGLPMGNSLSQVLADISTNHAVTMAMRKVNSRDVSFLFKFVDDFLGAMNPNTFVKFERELKNQIPNLSTKRTDESVDGGVSFLDCWIIRRENSYINMRWWQKDCSSQQILNFHSHHPYHMKKNLVNEYIRHAMQITSPSLRYITARGLQTVMKKSSYPENFYQNLIMDYTKTGLAKGPVTEERYYDHCDTTAERTIDGFVKVTSSFGKTDPDFSIADEFN
ncbi:hypothetical protein Bhyg_08041, partial [Pseudolycoriella hygida]